MEQRVNKLEEEMESCRIEIERALMMREHCPLDPYKEEMKQRCENFSDKIVSNKDAIIAATAEFNFKIVALENRIGEKIKNNRTIVGRMISSLIVAGVCLVGIVGGLQLSKVGYNEYNGHIDNYRIARSEEKQAFDAFLDTYTFDRDKRDTKIDALFNEQRNFNMQVMKTNSLLEQQLEIIKTKMEME